MRVKGAQTLVPLKSIADHTSETSSARVGGGGAPRAAPRQEGEDGRPHHAPASRPPGRARDVAAGAWRHGHARPADPGLGAGWETVARPRALMVSSALSLTAHGRLFVARGTPPL